MQDHSQAVAQFPGGASWAEETTALSVINFEGKCYSVPVKENVFQEHQIPHKSRENICEEVDLILIEFYLINVHSPPVV